MSQIETIGVILGVLVFCGLGVVALIISRQKQHEETKHILNIGK